MKLKQSIVILPPPTKKTVMVKAIDGPAYRFENSDVEVSKDCISIYTKFPKGLKRTTFPMHSISYFTIEEERDNDD